MHRMAALPVCLCACRLSLYTTVCWISETTLKIKFRIGDVEKKCVGEFLVQLGHDKSCK